jgi:MFS family permease
VEWKQKMPRCGPITSGAGVISYLALYLQNTLGYSPVQGGLRFLALSLVSFAVAPLTGRLIGRVPMRVLLGTAMVAATAGLASMARLSAGSGWLVLLPGLILSGIGLGICSTALSTAALSAVEPARAGMAAGMLTHCGKSARRPAWPYSGRCSPPG